jgi:protein SCO1/2
VPPRLALVLATLTVCAAAALAGVLIAEARRDPAPALQLGPTGFAGSLRPPGVPAPALTGLRDQDGEPVRMAEQRGVPVIVTFAYSTCEDTCPAQVQTIRAALDELGRDLPVLAVSVDPNTDSPARARRFVAEQRMTGRMRFLLGDRHALRRVWDGYAIAPQRGELDHTATVVLVDGRGRQRVSFPYDGLTADALAHDLGRLASGA